MPRNACASDNVVALFLQMLLLLLLPDRPPFASGNWYYGRSRHFFSNSGEPLRPQGRLKVEFPSCPVLAFHCAKSSASPLKLAKMEDELV